MDRLRGMLSMSQGGGGMGGLQQVSDMSLRLYAV